MRAQPLTPSKVNNPGLETLTACENQLEDASEAQSEVFSDENNANFLPCRICLEDTLEDDDDNFLMPCSCKGTMNYVHESCLKHWIFTQLKNTRNSLACQVCGARYNYRFEVVEEICSEASFKVPWKNIIISSGLLFIMTAISCCLAIFWYIGAGDSEFEIPFSLPPSEALAVWYVLFMSNFIVLKFSIENFVVECITDAFVEQKVYWTFTDPAMDPQTEEEMQENLRLLRNYFSGDNASNSSEGDDDEYDGF